MTLYQIQWSVFDDKEKQDMLIKTFIQLVQDQVSPKQSPEEESLAGPSKDISVLITKRGGRLNTKLRAQTTVRDIGGEDLHIDNFWDRNFPTDSEVPWYKFQKCFLEDYEAQLAGEKSVV